MWKKLKISEQTYFVYCSLSEKTQDITFILYDFTITWCQTINFKELKHKVKLLNKRFDFNDENIREALTSDTIQSAVLHGTTHPESCTLKLKYHVKNCLLSYEWCLKKQNLLEFQQTFVYPLLLTLLECDQQIQILADIVRKKDIELKEFRREGAVLTRKTLATKPFDFDDFNAKFGDCKKTANNFIDLANYVRETENNVEPKVKWKRTEKTVKSDESVEGDQKSPNIKMSPRQKKRKANEIKMEHLERHLKLSRRGLEYESSQSQTASTSSSETIEGIEKINFKSTTAKEHEIYKAENLLSTRKSTRCAILRQKQRKMSSDEKTHSDNEDHFRTSNQKKVTKSFDARKPISSTKSNDQESNTNSKNISPQEAKQMNLISLDFSNNTMKRTQGESISANISSSLTESNNEQPVLERKNSQKNKKEPNSQNLTDNKSPVLDLDGVSSIQSLPPNNSLSHSSAPVLINEISSQLDNIKKELETLEAMRLADLQQRTCKV